MGWDVLMRNSLFQKWPRVCSLFTFCVHRAYMCVLPESTLGWYTYLLSTILNRVSISRIDLRCCRSELSFRWEKSNSVSSLTFSSKLIHVFSFFLLFILDCTSTRMFSICFCLFPECFSTASREKKKNMKTYCTSLSTLTFSSPSVRLDALCCVRRPFGLFPATDPCVRILRSSSNPTPPMKLMLIAHARRSSLGTKKGG